MINKLLANTKLAISEFKNDQRGVTAIEYAIIGVAVSAIVLAVFNGNLSDALTAAMTQITTNIGLANTP